MKKILLALVITGARLAAYNEPAPYGMVLI